MDEIHQLAADFFGALRAMEKREGEERLVDKRDDYLVKCVNEAKEPLSQLIQMRRTALVRCETGHKGYKATRIRQNVIHKCKEDILFFVNYWGWIFNPWLTRFDSLTEGGFPSKIPYVLFPKTEEYLLWREDLYRKNRIGLVYKCREIGASWANCASQVWHWMFEDNYQGRMGSRKEGMVDAKGNPDTLFWKLRYIIYSTPKWMRHPDMSTRNNQWDNLLKIQNPLNGAVLGGEGGDNMGTGGRASIYDIDEWAKVSHDKLVESGLSANCRCRIYTGTPNGMDNDYARKYHSGKVPIFDFDWREDPRKSEDWYLNFREDHDEAIVAQEIDRKFDAMNVGQCIPPDWVNASVMLYEKIQRGEITVPDAGEKVSGMDVAAGGKNFTVMLYREGPVIRDCFEWNERNTTTITEKSGSQAEQLGVETFNYDPISVGVGVRSALERMDFTFNAVGVDYRGAASEEPLPGDTKPARERCLNRRAELAIRMRKRFEKTYEFITKGISHNIMDMIAIPNHPSLRTQLSVPDLLSNGGKWRLESKESMVKRGVPSPDYFDACVIACANEGAEKRVISSYNDSECDDFTINWGVVNGTDAKHYVAVQHEKDTKAGALGAVWYHGSNILQVYNEILVNTPTVSQMVNDMRMKFGTSVHEYIGNRECFGQQEQDSLFMQYLDYIMLYENVHYDPLSAIAQIEQMVQQNRLHIHPRCQNLRAQLADWDRVKGGIAKLSKTLAYALCNMVNYLEEQGVLVDKSQGPVNRYTRQARVPEPMTERNSEDSWMTR